MKTWVKVCAVVVAASTGLCCVGLGPVWAFDLWGSLTSLVGWDAPAEESSSGAGGFQPAGQSCNLESLGGMVVDAVTDTAGPLVNQFESFFGAAVSAGQDLVSDTGRLLAAGQFMLEGQVDSVIENGLELFGEPATRSSYFSDSVGLIVDRVFDAVPDVERSLDDTWAGISEWAIDTAANFYGGGWLEDPIGSFGEWTADNRNRALGWEADNISYLNNWLAYTADEIFVGENRQQAVDRVLDNLSATFGEKRVQEVFQQDFSTDAGNRFFPADLRELMINRLDDCSDDRPLAVVVYPQADHNGAFYNQKHQVMQLIDSGYRVMFYTADSDQDAINSILEGTAYGMDPAALILICGHGSPESTQFGEDYWTDEGEVSDHAVLDVGDADKTSLLRNSLQDNGQVVFLSCSVGGAQEDGQNMVDFFGSVFPQASVVAGATESISYMHLTIVGNTVTDVSYRKGTINVDTYDSAAEKAAILNQQEVRAVLTIAGSGR